MAQEYVSSEIPDYYEYEHDGSSRYELAENEELIGVYGFKDYYENIITFGFVVKVKPEQASYTWLHCPAYTPEPVQPDDTPLPIDSYVIPSDNNNDEINNEEDSQEDESKPKPSFANMAKKKDKFLKKYFKDQVLTEKEKDAIDTLFDDIFGGLAESIEDLNNN